MTIYDNFFFDKYIQFVDNDNRNQRGFHPINAETLSKKHECIAPKWLVEGARILDLGSCIGATGHWCLSHGAIKYVGVEVQADYVNISKQLLGELWSSDKFEIIEQDIEEYLASVTEQFDVVFACGVIYGFLDYYGILKKITAASSRCVIIDTSYPVNMSDETSCIIEIVKNQHLNKSTDNDSFSGVGSRSTPVALNLLMNNLGFENKEKILYPQQINDNSIHDSYHSPILRKNGLHTPARFLMRFFKTGNYLKSVNEALLTNDNKYVTSMVEAPTTLSKVTPWVFDETVAHRFQNEAATHIPDYERVIDMCVNIVKYSFPKTANIIDVGSALGFTVDKFLKAGYTSVTGLEISESMKNNSLHQDRIILSNSMPNEEYNVVLANWTLHFILERKEYLTDIFNRLAHGGILLLSEKMSQPYPLKDLYYNWKQSNGVSRETILSKEQKLKGVLETKPLIWYLEILEKIGFAEVECINSRFGFNTLICKKI